MAELVPPRSAGARSGVAREDTRAILRVSLAIEVVGILCAIIVAAQDGFRWHGPRTNIGWLSLIISMGCLPTGTFFLLLGLAKLVEDRKRQG